MIRNSINLICSYGKLTKFSFHFHSAVKIFPQTVQFSEADFILRKMSSSQKVNIKEIEGDLFSAPENVSLAHCVGADMAMGAGIAVKFRQIYGKVDELLNQNVSTGGVAVLKDKKRCIYYLVTKQYSYEKPTYDSLKSSLTAMKDHMNQNNVDKLAIPRIGCGIDGLEWDKVKAQLYEVFGPEQIEITVYNFVPK